MEMYEAPKVEVIEVEVEKGFAVSGGTEGKGEKLEAWDWWYYAEKLRQEKYDLNEDAIKPYFSQEDVKGTESDRQRYAVRSCRSDKACDRKGK